MTVHETIENAKQNIRQALHDYGKHTDYTDVIDDCSDRFIDALAEDSTRAKRQLRELFSKSPVWDEKLDALVINGTRTHNPDYEQVEYLARVLLAPAFNEATATSNREKANHLDNAVLFFSTPYASEERREAWIASINTLAPRAYAANKKLSRVFKSICDALSVTDDSSGSDFQKYYAQFADELSAKKIGFKLFVSINPAHFITMSNPKHDDRGNTLTSCHSFNSTEYEYNVGCTGYARDKWSFVVFTASDLAVPETLNNRKTTRQTFAYKPGNGLLMQSRLYNTSGGTQGAQEESKLYRDLVQREISELENQPNLWKTHSFLNDGYSHSVGVGDGFGGYCDWTYEGFEGKVSIRADAEDEYEPITVGTYGLCVICGEETSHGVYCDDCKGQSGERCDCCEGHYHESELYLVYHGGEEVYVCDSCRDDEYYYCERCGEYHYVDDVTEVGSQWVCDGCLDNYYTRCEECGEYFDCDDTYTVQNTCGYEINVCGCCRDEHYTECSHCGEYIHFERVVQAHDINGSDIEICQDCAEVHYVPCVKCEELFISDAIENGHCTWCARDKEEENEEELQWTA
jgi:hypothetical protein